MEKLVAACAQEAISQNWIYIADGFLIRRERTPVGSGS
jgi:hypothetical protein